MADWHPPRPHRPSQITVHSDSAGNVPRSGSGDDPSSTTGTPISLRNLLPYQPSTAQYSRPPVAYPIYNSSSVLPSSKTFLTPAMVRGPQPFNDYSPESPSPLSLRKTSWESAKRRDSLNGLFFHPSEMRMPGRVRAVMISIHRRSHRNTTVFCRLI